MVAPERDGEGDAAFAGTSFHAAVEQFLTGNLALHDMEQYAQQYATKGAANGVTKDGVTRRIEYKSFDGPPEMVYHAGNCTRGWIDDVLPVLVARGEHVGEAEVRFEYEAFHYRDHTIMMQGTVDWVPSHGRRLYDWKSSGSDYKQKDKQQYAIQPTTYVAAAVNGCFGRPFDFPMEFAYGVAIRLKTKARGQIVVVERNQSHVDWMNRRIRHYVDLYLDVGLDREWPTDEEHFLCSSKWCPWYDSCRGKHVSRDMDAFGWVPQAKPPTFTASRRIE